MSFFKKNIAISQFAADAIYNSFNFYDSNIDKMLDMDSADEFKVMESKDKDELKESGYSLIIADLMVSGQIHFGDKISNEELSELIGSLYVKFMNEVKQLEMDEIEEKTKNLKKLLFKLEESEEKADGTANGLKLLLCSVFSEMYSSGDLRDKKVEGKRFAAFKLAKAIVKADLINTMLKEFRIDFKTL